METNHHVAEDLETGKLYKFAVVANNIHGSSEESSQIEILVAAAPDKPNAVVVSAD